MDIKQLFEDILQQKFDKKLKKKYNISDKDIEFARKEMAKSWKVDLKDMVYVAIFAPIDDIVGIMFNIMDPKHKMYKSTRTYQWLPKEKRGVSK